MKDGLGEVRGETAQDKKKTEKSSSPISAGGTLLVHPSTPSALPLNPDAVPFTNPHKNTGRWSSPSWEKKPWSDFRAHSLGDGGFGRLRLGMDSA